MIVGFPYSYEMPLPKAGTGTAPFDFSIVAPVRPLPNGITFDPETRLLEGVPAVGTEQEETPYIYRIIDAARPNRTTDVVFYIAVAADTDPTLPPISRQRHFIVNRRDNLRYACCIARDLALPL